MRRLRRDPPWLVSTRTRARRGTALAVEGLPGRLGVRAGDVAGEVGLRPHHARDPVDLARVRDLVLVVGDGDQHLLVGLEEVEAGLAAAFQHVLVYLADARCNLLGIPCGLGHGCLLTAKIASSLSWVASVRVH